MPIDTKYRSSAPEIMDDFNMQGDILTDALDKIASINKLLGGNKATLDGIKALLKNKNLKGKIQLIDVGCGNGAMLRMLADYGKKYKLDFELKGIDANKCTIEHAKSLSLAYSNISYQTSDIFDKTSAETCDIMLYTLTLHHFTDADIIRLLKIHKKVVRLGIVVNDLERSALAYRLFKALCYAFKLNDMSREDGLVSILRGFKKADFLRYEKELNLSSAYIKWKWAFRYLWLIKTQ
jgi:2-polyprenyl-3-methyl-5-hydroxy-6-metoxy-1,4-benzoquinol methylase